MPKDEFDFEDPLELNGMAFLSQEDTTNDMAECFAEEFMRLGYDHRRVMALFANPHYLGPHLAFQQRGEAFIRDLITNVFARWGRRTDWPDPTPVAKPPGTGPADQPPAPATESGVSHVDEERVLTDPTGAPIPIFKI
ncbi:MAG: hypothetical protein JNK85_24350 [Verrucomicrobiales bacterium]|nr:hypothetical protein [Verrucomicrobiales bacterium]